MTLSLVGSLPLVAILRGLEPERAAEVGRALVETGFDIIEVPLNSPGAYRSIAALAYDIGDRAIVGAGTVLASEEVDRLSDIGARLVVSPNCHPPVIHRAVGLGMISLPGALTPTEMFAALAAGASGIKIFPAELASPAAVRAVRAVLPSAAPIYVVGGIHSGNMSEYLAAGATGFGLGGALFKPGKAMDSIARDAAAAVASFRAALALGS